MTWQFILVGLGLGLVVGITGVGGGSLMTPILIIFFGFSPQNAVGTDIVPRRDLQVVRRVAPSPSRHRARASRVVAVRGLRPVRHRRRDRLVVSAEPDRERGDDPQDYAIGIALIVGGLGFLAKSFVKRGVQPSEAPFIMSRRDKLIALATGAVFGFIVGLTSVGSGTYFGLVMVLAYPLTMSRIVGTDIFHAAALLSVAGVGHAFIGDVDWHAVLFLMIGSIPGILISSRWTVSVPQTTIRLGLGGILLISGINLLDKNKSLPSWLYAAASRRARGRGRGVHLHRDARPAHRSRTLLTNSLAPGP